MKKVIFVIALLFSSYFSYAQINAHTAGVRLGGDGDINGAELTYQHGLSQTNRVEFDLGFAGNDHHNRMYLAGIYHWHWNIDGGLNWYAGPGAALGFFSYDESDSYFNIGVGGQVGIEYNFNHMNAPILLSIDARPMWDLIGDDASLGWGAALGIRYTW
ncbi:MAG: hypothetical protein R6T91_09720 [Bacteroidales bacterium]